MQKLVFRPIKCLRCDSNFTKGQGEPAINIIGDEIHTDSGGLAFGEILCPICHEKHDFRVHETKLTLELRSVPLNYTGARVRVYGPVSINDRYKELDTHIGCLEDCDKRLEQLRTRLRREGLLHIKESTWRKEVDKEVEREYQQAIDVCNNILANYKDLINLDIEKSIKYKLFELYSKLGSSKEAVEALMAVTALVSTKDPKEAEKTCREVVNFVITLNECDDPAAIPVLDTNFPSTYYKEFAEKLGVVRNFKDMRNEYQITTGVEQTGESKCVKKKFWQF